MKEGLNFHSADDSTALKIAEILLRIKAVSLSTGVPFTWA